MADEKDRQTATMEETKPINSVDMGCSERADGEVQVKDPDYKGCLVTRVQCVLITLAVLISLILVGVLVAILLPQESCGRDGNSSNNGEDNNKLVTPKPTLDPSLPWAGIRLPRTLIPSHYDIELRVDLDKFIFTGAVEITLNVHKETEYVIVHVNSLKINESDITVRDAASRKRVQIRRKIAVPENQFHVLELQSQLQKGKDYLVRYGSFQGKMLDDLRGLYRSSYKKPKDKLKYLAASQLQSVDARKVFPCLDEPDLKARFTVSIIHKPEYTALSNMPYNGTILESGEWRKCRFLTTPLMSTYLLAFVVADFTSRETIIDGGLKIRIWAQPDVWDQTAYALKFASKAYKFFADYFGTPEIVPKADHVAVPDFSAGAMENWGLVLYRETALLHDEMVSSISNKYWVSLVMAHEIAHTWFGNMVTMKWWTDLWLNEGFANTLMYFALDGIYKDWKVFDLQLVNNLYPVMTKDSLLTSHPISTQIKDPDDIPQFFDSISYDKGMSVLRLLRGFLGWDDFRIGLQMYIKNYKYRNAEMKELWQTFTEAVGYKYNVSEIMDTWTRQTGFPVVKLIPIGPGYYRLDQSRFLLNPDDSYDPSDSPFRYKWRIPFTYRVQNSKENKTQWMEMTSANITIPVDSWIIGNVDYMGFYRTNYDDAMWHRLIAQLKTDHKVFSTANRAGLITDAFNLARANKLNYEIALNLSSYLHKEDEFVPWRAFLDAMDFLRGMLSTSNCYGLLQKYMRDLVSPKYLRTGSNTNHGTLLERNFRRAMLQAASSVDVQEAIEMARARFKEWMTQGSQIPSDDAVVIYSIGIQHGGEKEWDYLWKKAESTRVASEAEIMMTALAYTQKPWLLWRYVRWAFDSTKIRMQDVRNLFRYFSSTPLGRSVALQFMLTNWDKINERFGVDVFLLRDVIYATTSFINTEFEYKQLRDLYKNKPPVGVASKAAENSLALIRSNIKWMNLNHDTIFNWLKQNTRKHK